MRLSTFCGLHRDMEQERWRKQYRRPRIKPAGERHTSIDRRKETQGKRQRREIDGRARVETERRERGRDRRREGGKEKEEKYKGEETERKRQKSDRNDVLAELEISVWG